MGVSVALAGFRSYDILFSTYNNVSFYYPRRILLDHILAKGCLIQIRAALSDCLFALAKTR